jgi:SAM-dependent methyltransferase
VDPSAYDAWYASPRGGWIGDVETSLLLRLLACRDGDSILDVGCGTGYFSRRLAQIGFHVTGVDVEPHALEFAARKDGHVRWLRADARELPFGDRSFDCAVAVTNTPRVARSWARQLQPPPAVSVRSAVFGTSGGIAARVLEKILPNCLSFGGFLALALSRRVT